MAFDPANAAAISADSVRIIHLLRMDFDGGVLALSDAVGEFDYNGDTYLGAGTLISIGDIKQDQQHRPAPLRITLSGIDADIMANVNAEDYTNRDADLMLMLLTPDFQPIANPETIHSGFIDSMDVSISQSTGTAAVSVSIQDRFARFNRPQISRWSYAEQQRLNPGDKSFEFVDQIPEQAINWGGTPLTPVRANQGPQSTLDLRVNVY